jgi:EmrB/QacA subfamily drug resistance transporter
VLGAVTGTSRGLVLASVLAGTFVGTINNSVANVAVLDVIDEFEIDLTAAVWFVTGYVLAFAVLMPAAGRLADVYGTRPVYLGGLACFAASSIAVALAPSYPFAVLGRVVQGVCNAPVLPTVMVTVAAVFPAGERGRAMGVWAAANGAAIALGPPLGGWITEAFGWRAVFWADVPLAVVALAMAWRWLPATPARHAGRLDVAGGVLLTFGLVGTMVALSQGPGWGWTHPAVLAGFAGGGAALVLFVQRCAHTDAPFLDLTVLRNRRYAVLSAIAGLQMVVLFGVLFIVPLLLVSVFDRGVGVAGAASFALPVTMVIAGPWMGQYADRFGARRLTAIGATALMAAAAVLGMALATTSLLLLVAGLVVVGAGVSAIQSPTASGVAEEVSEANRGVAMGLFHTIRFLAGVLGTAAFAVVFTAVSGDAALEVVVDDRLRRAFAVDLTFAGIVALAALGVSRLVPARAAS